MKYMKLAAVDFGEVTNPLPKQGPYVGIGLGNLITNVITTLSLIAGVVMVLYLVWGGIAYVTAGGDQKKTEQAQKVISNAIMGIIIVAIATALAQIIGNALGFDSILSPVFPTI